MVAAWVHEQGGCNSKEEVDAFISSRSNVESKKRIDAKKALDDDMTTHVEELLPKLQDKFEKRKGSAVTMYSFYRFCQTLRNDEVFGQCSASFSFFKEHTAPLLVSKLLPDAHPHPDKINGYAFSDDADRPVSSRKRARVLPKPTMSSTSTTTETLVPPPPPPSVVVNVSTHGKDTRRQRVSGESHECDSQVGAATMVVFSPPGETQGLQAHYEQMHPSVTTYVLATNFPT